MIKFILILFLLSIPISGIYAENTLKKQQIRHFGYCELCGAYRYCIRKPTYQEAVNALRLYFARMGFKVAVIKHEGRFIKAIVYKNGKADMVLLDIRTGLIRSVY